MERAEGVEKWRRWWCRKGLPRVLSSHIGLRKEMSSVKLQEWSVLFSPAGSTEGAFVHHHLAPITARQNSFSTVGRRVNGPGVGCEERPCPHTPTRGQGLIGPSDVADEILATFCQQGNARTKHVECDTIRRTASHPEQSCFVEVGWLRKLGADGQSYASQTGVLEGQNPSEMRKRSQVRTQTAAKLCTFFEASSN